MQKFCEICPALYNAKDEVHDQLFKEYLYYISYLLIINTVY